MCCCVARQKLDEHANVCVVRNISILYSSMTVERPLLQGEKIAVCDVCVLMHI
jgi:hypothetical protein